MATAAPDTADPQPTEAEGQLLKGLLKGPTAAIYVARQPLTSCEKRRWIETAPSPREYPAYRFIQLTDAGRLKANQL